MMTEEPEVAGASGELSKSDSMSSMKKNKKKRGSSVSRTSLIERARMSFFRSSGVRGADIKTLRGHGADFEGEARVTRGVEGLGLNCCGCFGGGEYNKDRILLVKGPFCFVFVSQLAPSPKYAIALESMRAQVKSQALHGRYHCTLETNLGDVQYELSFTTLALAQYFQSAVAKQSDAADVELIRKRLGHEKLITKRSSVRFAESIAKKKVEDQPDAPISNDEIMSNMPVTPLGGGVRNDLPY